jgi:Fimbrial assembly protein (PilN)
MKITTNFVRPAQRMVAPVAAAMWAAAALLAAGAAWLAHDAAGLRGDLPPLRTRLERVDAQKPVAAAPLPPARELAETRDKVARINAAAQTRGAPTLALLADMEKQLPPDAWLTSIHHRATEGEVQLVAAATRADPLSEFLLRLERDPLFEEVMLLREVQAGGSRAGVQYEIRLKVRP